MWTDKLYHQHDLRLHALKHRLKPSSLIIQTQMFSINFVPDSCFYSRH